ncbi:hypothetical protein GCM10007925_15550 [Sphingomonas astaxanthinifaciens DSM 22298]|uniref:Transposase n=1 Tax=Sphingomonas astaxanthinifaciens DSM 22298 TaxID=1123267 RepID=A0ABQ5ZB66_9SPHN|nr:hypothetical protein GCM10007925_15550 [Sphingomonas astaxanthinifaciens DSM 22298]
MHDAGRFRRLEQDQMRVMVDGPGIARRPRSRGEAGNDRIEPLPPKPVPSDRAWVGHIADPDLGPGKTCLDRRRRRTPNQAHHLMPPRHQRPHRRPPDRPRRPDEENAAGNRRAGFMRDAVGHPVKPAIFGASRHPGRGPKSATVHMSASDPLRTAGRTDMVVW